MNILKNFGLVIAGVVVGLLFSAVGPSSKALGIYEQTTAYFAQGLRIGEKGTTISTDIATTCNLIGTDASQGASTTVPYDCAVTNVTSTFTTLAQLASSTVSRATNGGQHWVITASKASSTAGFVTVLVTNNGAAAVPSAFGVGSSTAIRAWAN